jgi:RNA polymerase sigma-70 factor (ECF subfamily)
VSLELKEQYDKIYKYCYFKVKNTHLAEDLTQETFLKYFSQNTYISKGKPLAYLYTIAKNLCIDAYRKPEAMQLDETADEIPAENNIDELETNIIINQAVRTLPEDLQEIVMLRFANDLSVLDISRIIGLSRFAVRRKINSTLNKLKLVLREEDFS